MSYTETNCLQYFAAPLAAGMMVSPAVGYEATSIQEEYKPSYQAISYAQEPLNLLSELDEIYSESSFDGWDGSQSIGVDAQTLKYAKEIILKLHEASLPLPEVCAEADGELCLDWIASRDRLFSMSISQKGLLSMLETDDQTNTRWHGSTYYKGALTSDISSILRKLKL